MVNPYWRSSSPQPWPWRDYVAERFPSGFDGFTQGDVDSLVRIWGSRYDVDRLGRFRLCEIKSHGRSMTRGQSDSYRLLHESCSTGIHRKRYDGFYTVSTAHADWTRCSEFVIARPFDRAGKVPDDLFAWHDADAVTLRSQDEFDAWYGWQWSPWWPA